MIQVKLCFAFFLKDEKDRLKKQKRALQESLDGKHSPVDRLSSTSSGSLRNRSQSLLGERPISPSVVNRMHNAENTTTTASTEHNNNRKYSIPSTGSPHSTINSKGYRNSPENTVSRPQTSDEWPKSFAGLIISNPLLGLASSPYVTSTVILSVLSVCQSDEVLILPTIRFFWFFASS